MKTNKQKNNELENIAKELDELDKFIEEKKEYFLDKCVVSDNDTTGKDYTQPIKHKEKLIEELELKFKDFESLGYNFNYSVYKYRNNIDISNLNIQWTLKQSNDKESIDTFIFKFEPPFVLFLYATTFNKKELITQLEVTYPHKQSFLTKYEDWIYTLTLTDLAQFKEAIIKQVETHFFVNKEFPLLSSIVIYNTSNDAVKLFINEFIKEPRANSTEILLAKSKTGISVLDIAASIGNIEMVDFILNKLLEHDLKELQKCITSKKVELNKNTEEKNSPPKNINQFKF